MSGARPDEGDIIEIVDADPTVFGAAPVVVDARDEPHEQRKPHREVSVWSVGLVVVLLAVAAGTVAWKLQPWHHDDAVYVRDHVATTTLTDHLVIADVAGAPVGALLPTAQPLPTEVAEGAVFIDAASTPGIEATANAIYSRFEPDMRAEVSFDPSATTAVVEVHGVSGMTATSGTSVVVRWRLADGTVQSLQTDRVSADAALRLANAITSDGHTVRVAPRSALGQLCPLGTVAESQHVVQVFVASQAFAQDPGGGASPDNDPSIFAVRYRTAGIAVGHGAGPDTLALIATSLPLRAHLEVHGLDALSFDLSASFGATPSTLTTVMWVEGGRLIAVCATSPALAQQYAQAVRPATDAEWRQVVQLSSSVPTN